MEKSYHGSSASQAKEECEYLKSVPKVPQQKIVDMKQKHGILLDSHETVEHYKNL